MRTTLSRFVTEILLWNAANVLCILLPTSAVYFVGRHMLEWGPGFLSFYLTTTVLATLTWGSWAALVWTRSRALRGGMQAMTLLPGVLTMLAGCAGLWVGFGAWWLWAGIIGAGAGTIATAVALVRFFRPLNREPSGSSYLFGFGVYPFVTTALALGVGALWYGFVTGSTFEDWRGLISIATLYVSVLASVLVSTVIPALTSSSLRKVSGDLF